MKLSSLQLKEKEQEYLSSEVFEYNIEKFVNKGMLGKKHTIKAKITIGLKNKDKYLGENNPNYGKKGELHHNYGKKMPQNGKCGIDHPNYGKVSINRKEVVQLDIDGIVINTFLSFKTTKSLILSLNLVSKIVFLYFPSFEKT